MKHIEKFTQAIKRLPEEIKSYLNKISDENKNMVFEIRLRSQKPINLVGEFGSVFLKKDGILSEKISDDCVILSPTQISESFESLCRFCIYSFDNEIRNGFITIEGGHRVGIASKNGVSGSPQSIYALNIRISKEFKNSCDFVKEYLKYNLNSILIAGPPNSGKTTVIRDIARYLAGEELRKKVLIVDERGEIASMYGNTPQNDIGIFSDVLSGYSKKEAVNIGLRCLSPEVIVFDEIGSSEDLKSIHECSKSGVKVVATIHAKDIEDIKQKEAYSDFISKGLFSKIYFLGTDKLIGKKVSEFDL